MRMTARAFRIFCVSCAIVVSGAACLTTGCKPSAEKRAAIEQRLVQEVDDLAARIQDCQSQGRFDEALALTDKGLSEPKYASHKARFYTLKTEILLARGDDAAAADLAVASVKTDPVLALELAGRVFSHYQQQNNHAATRIFSQRLLAIGAALPAPLRNQALNGNLTAALALRDQSAASDAIRAIAAALPPQEAIPLLQSAIGGLIDSGQHVLASALLASLAENPSLAPEYAGMIAMLNIRCVLAASDWNAFPDAFNACVARLPDDQLSKLLRQTFTALQKSGQKALLDQSSAYVFRNAPAKANAANYAARIWVECGVSVSKQSLPERLDALLKAGVSPVQVGNLFDRYFYDLIDDADCIKQLCKLGERVLSVCQDENTVNNLKVKILDGAFIVNNFDLAVKMLEDGIPGKDKMWHSMSLSKVKAHRAMAQNDPRAAVRYFRDFMNAWIDSQQEEEFDPTSGIAYSKEWILGRNANRIAKILDGIPDQAEADKARAEAKAYYKTAVEKAKNDAEATRLLKEETKDLGL